MAKKNGYFLIHNLLLKSHVCKNFSVVSNIVDITPERQLSREVKEGKALINAFFEQTPTLAWVIDEEATLHFASNAFYQHFGLNENECIGKKVTDIVPTAVSRTLYEKHIKVFENRIAGSDY